MRNALSTLVGIITSLVVGACVDPRGRLDEFAARVIDAKDTGQDCPGFTEIPNVTGRALFVVRIDNLPPRGGREPELFFDTQVTLQQNPDKTGELDLVAMPLTVEDRMPIGVPFTASAVPVDACGKFEAPFEGMISGKANPITGMDQTVIAKVHGNIRSADLVCGMLSGSVPIDLSATTFGAVRWTGDALPTAVVRCPE